MKFVVGVDVGGTFTDLVCIDEEGNVAVVKTPSTPADPSIAVIDALTKVAGELRGNLETLLPDVIRICKYVDREQMFTFVIHPDISWENNAAERAVRVIASIRNNTGGRRTRKGADSLQALLSVFETWRKRGLDVYKEAKVALIRHVGRVSKSDAMA